MRREPDSAAADPDLRTSTALEGPGAGVDPARDRLLQADGVARGHRVKGVLTTRYGHARNGEGRFDELIVPRVRAAGNVPVVEVRAEIGLLLARLHHFPFRIG